MVNDITTLNGSLAQLGETLASNITQKGVQASASDGLTTLASKVLQISGGGPTVIYSPSLDGTEAITSITARTPTISNNEFGTGCGYLTDGWDNTIDWELTFDYYTTGFANGYLVIPKGTSSRDYNGVQQWNCDGLNFYVQGETPTGGITGATTCNQWISVKITKIGYVWTVYYDDVQKTTWDLESYASTVDTWTEMCIGTDRYSDFQYSLIKNIVVKTIDDSGCSTVLFEDDCNSASGLTNYGSSVLVRGSNATITMTYDSTENAYQLSGSGNYHAMIPIPTLDDQDNYKISADFKAQNIQYNSVGFFLDNRNDTTSYGQAFFLNIYSQRLDGHEYKVSQDGASSNSSTVSSLSANNYYHIEMIILGSVVSAKLYDSNLNELTSTTHILSVENKQMGIFLFCEKGSTDSVCYVKNIKAKTLGGL